MITDGELGSDGIDPQATQRGLRGGSVTSRRWSPMRRRHRSNGGWSR